MVVSHVGIVVGYACSGSSLCLGVPVDVTEADINHASFRPSSLVTLLPLIVWGGEFGRTPDNRKGFFATYPGRDHNKNALVMWFAGGGVKGGTVVGSTDELGLNSAENRYHLHDMHATILNLMGLNDMRLTFHHGGRLKRLTDLGGRVIKEMLA